MANIHPGEMSMPPSRLAANTALLTAASLLMSAIGMGFQTWLVGRIGAAGIGLYQLTLSVTNLAATFAISGVRFASTRLVSEELGGENDAGVHEAMRRCLGYAVFFGSAALLCLWLLAGPIGCLAIRDARTVPSLRLAACSMPCISLCASISGYFTACGRVWKSALTHLLEELLGLALAALFLSRVETGDLRAGCAAVTRARLCADWAALGLLWLFYRFDRIRHPAQREPSPELTGRLLRIALPLAVSAYARSALGTVQHLLVPRGLRAAGFSAERALAGYGVLQGMALPVVLFPSCVLGALAELTVPLLTGAQVRGEAAAIRRTVSALLRRSLLYALAAALFLFCCAEPLGWYLYKSREAGTYIRLLSPLIPVMYLDMTVDGCLKGLGEQLWSMGVNIAESLLGLALALLLLPRFALDGYIALVYLTELFNFIFSLSRLSSILSAPCDGRPPCGAAVKYACTAAASAANPPRP